MYNIPNLLTLSRIIVIPAIFLMVYIHSAVWQVIAAVLFIIASITDYFDGYLARRMGETSALGRLLDPIADKILVISTMICFIPIGACRPAVVIIVVSREFIISSLRCLAASKSVVIAAGKSGKIKTAFQMVSIISILLLQSIDSIIENAIPINTISNILMWLTVVPTVISCIEYIVRNRDVISN